MNKFLIFIIAIIVTESITEIVSKSKLFSPILEWFFNRRQNKIFNFIHNLLECPYCLSVWVGTIVGVCTVDIRIVSPIIDWFIIGLLLHRLANLLHNGIDRTRKNDF
ncbi:DUF1360 domain-containing protein [bacterium]|nr:DUF1360 domain-containing protein [bacterium]